MIFYKQNLNKSVAAKNIGGFTLVELMVAISIYILMAALLFVNQDKFNSSLSFSNLGYDIALTLRQAQTYGYAVSGQTNTGTNSFVNAFGVHFDTSTPTSFTVFYEPIQHSTISQNGSQPTLPTILGPQSTDFCGDTPDCPYAPVTLSTYNLQNGYQISALCYPEGGKDSCGSLDKSNGTCQTVGSSVPAHSGFTDIIFQRPNTNAFIYKKGQNNKLLSQASIELTSPTGDKECVTVFQSGNIEVGPVTASVPQQ